MKKISIFTICCATAALSHSQTTWNLEGNAPSALPRFGTMNNYPLNFLTNGATRMSISTSGALRVMNLAGTGQRLLAADEIGNISPYSGGVAQKDFILHGDGVFRSTLFSTSGTSISTPDATRLGIGRSNPTAALDVVGDIAGTGKVTAAQGFLFAETDGVTFDQTENVFTVGKIGIGLNTGIDPCNNLPSPSTLGWVHAPFAGLVSTQINPTSAPNVNAALRMYVAPSSGNGYLELSGKDQTNSPNNALFINYNCARNTHINTGPYGGNVNICNAGGGNVGIGTSYTGTSRLSVSGSNIGLSVNTSHTADMNYNTMLTVNRNYAKALAVVSTEVNPLGDENFIVYGDGRTRIGGDYNNSFNENYYKLSVNGAMIAEEVVIMLRPNWPDYVFSKNYQLKPLEEVESFINEHAHLPNIPSQEEVKENGVSTGEMLQKQMEKIEELTLYLIDLNKKVETLKTENADLKNRLK